jgi:hypothetical protein
MVIADSSQSPELSADVNHVWRVVQQTAESAFVQRHEVFQRPHDDYENGCFPGTEDSRHITRQDEVTDEKHKGEEEDRVDEHPGH